MASTSVNAALRRRFIDHNMSVPLFGSRLATTLNHHAPSIPITPHLQLNTSFLKGRRIRHICEAEGGWRRERKKKKKKKMVHSEIVRKAEALVEKAMKGNDASHDAAHVWRVRDLALSLASEEGLSSDPHSMEIVELAALLHDIGDYKYLSDPSEEKIVENFLEEEGVEKDKKSKILKIIKGMGFKEEVSGKGNSEWFPEFGVVQDADRLDAIGAIGIARCFTFGGSRKRALHDPAIPPRTDLSKEQYMNKEEQTTINHFHEKLFKLKDMMKTKAGQRRAERRHKFMVEFVKEFYDEWNGLS